MARTLLRITMAKIFLKEGGVQGQISWKHDFEITGDPKGPVGQLFGGVLRPQTHMGTCGAAPLFRAKKSKMANKAQKMAELWPKNVCPYIE